MGHVAIPGNIFNHHKLRGRQLLARIEVRGDAKHPASTPNVPRAEAENPAPDV